MGFVFSSSTGPPNYLFGITQANVCIKLCILLKQSYQVSCVRLRYGGKCDKKVK